MIYVLMAIATALTYGMFQNRQSLLGFPAAIFWALAGALAYQSVVTPWDMMGLLGFACLAGMIPLTVMGAYSFRSGAAEKDEEATFDDEDYFDEDSQTTKTRRVKKKKAVSDDKEDKKRTDDIFEIGSEKREDDEDGLGEATEPRDGRKGKRSVWGAFR